jgi:isopentenyldiphosphate isomerase
VVRGCIEIPELQIRDCEFQQTFRGVYDGPITADPGEVSDVRRITMSELAASIGAAPDDFTPWLRSRLRAYGPRLCAFGQL